MDLPIELYRPVVENVTNVYDVRNILLTSRALYFEALRVIYHSAEITYTRDEDDLKGGPAFKVIQPSDSHPLHYPLLLGSDHNRIVHGPGEAHPVDVATFLYKLDIRLGTTKAWIRPVLEAAVNLKWLGLVRLRDYLSFGPVDPSKIDERGLPFSALMGLKPRFKLHTFVTNLPGDEHMRRFLEHQDDIATFSWLPPAEYPISYNLFDDVSPDSPDSSLLPNLHKFSFNNLTEFITRQPERRITHAEYTSPYFLESARDWQALDRLVVLRVSELQVAFNQLHTELLGALSLPSLQYLDTPGYLLGIWSSLPALRCLRTHFTEMSQKDVMEFTKGRFTDWPTLEKVVHAMSTKLVERRRENPEVVWKLQVQEHEDAWMTGVWSGLEYSAEVTILRDDEY